jgi:ABC-type amino acid transport substrate-binding protein
MGKLFAKRDFLRLLTSAAVAAPTAFVAAKATRQDKKSQSTYDRVISSGTLRCAYTPYSVGLMKDPNTGVLSGIYYDIVTRLAANLSLNLVWAEEVGWASQIEGLNAKRYDLIASPVSLNSGRARSADFSIPLFYSPAHIWARPDNHRVTPDLKTLNRPDIKISTLDGEQTSTFARQFFPQAQQVSLPQTAPFSDLLLQVTDGKADFVISEPTAIFQFLKNNPDSLRQITPNDHPLLVVPNIILLPRGEYEFKEMIDNSLREMFNSRLIDAAIDAYEPIPNSYVRETARR